MHRSREKTIQMTSEQIGRGGWGAVKASGGRGEWGAVKASGGRGESKRQVAEESGEQSKRQVVEEGGEQSKRQVVYRGGWGAVRASGGSGLLIKLFNQISFLHTVHVCLFAREMNVAACTSCGFTVRSHLTRVTGWQRGELSRMKCVMPL